MSKINGLDDTIAAISTPIGEGGIGIVRISGRRSLPIADKVFISNNGSGKPSGFKTYTTHYGWVVDSPQRKNRNPSTINHQPSTKVIDEVILTVMRSPKSYTKEDIVEINCHSGIVPLKKILDLVIANGARLAQPGEFTKRAFLNGRLDLAQAEAVIDIINAKTILANKAASNQLMGGLSKKIKEFQNEILGILTQIEASLDFPEEELDLYANKSILNGLKKAYKGLKILSDTSQAGIILRQGLLAVICGRPNVGKSTLMNRLLRQDRVIVTPIAGTTRDAIEESVTINNIPLRLVDTAGIIDGNGLVEKEAAAKSKRYIGLCDIVFFVLDASSPLKKDDLKLFDLVKGKKVILILNKIDLPLKIDIYKIKKYFRGLPIVKVSAAKGIGIEELEKRIEALVWGGQALNSAENIITNSRHRQGLLKALENLEAAVSDLEKRSSLEFIAINLYAVLRSLGEIVGDVSTEEMLDRIFSQFCIGK